MFEVGGRQAVSSDHGPAVGEGLYPVGAEVDHGLDCKGHAGPDCFPGVAAAEVWDLRFLMHRAADPVADQVANDAKAARLNEGLDGVGDVADAIAHLGLADADLKGLLSCLQQTGNLGIDGADGYGDGVVADVSAGLDGDVQEMMSPSRRIRLREPMP